MEDGLSPTKKCPVCEMELPRGQFGTRKAASGNVVSASPCKACARDKARKYYDPVKAAARFQRLMQDRPDHVRERSRNYALRNPEKRSRWVADWREKNAQYVLEYARAYKLEHRVIATAWQRKRDAVKRSATVVPFTESQLHQRMSMFTGCWMCGGPKEHIDHVKPLSKGGAHMLCNLRPACQSCNLRKKDKWPLGDRVSSR